jgi:hypothetical protein
MNPIFDEIHFRHEISVTKLSARTSRSHSVNSQMQSLNTPLSLPQVRFPSHHQTSTFSAANKSGSGLSLGKSHSPAAPPNQDEANRPWQTPTQHLRLRCIHADFITYSHGCHQSSTRLAIAIALTNAVVGCESFRTDWVVCEPPPQLSRCALPFFSLRPFERSTAENPNLAVC